MWRWGAHLSLVLSHCPEACQALLCGCSKAAGMVELISLGVQVPFTFKYAVDALTLDPTGATLTASPILPLLPATMLAAYGVARISSSACNELRSAVFAKVCRAPGSRCRNTPA